MATPRQMFDHRLNPVKGWPSPYALDKAKEVESGAAEQGIVSGMVVHIDATSGKFKRGLGGNNVPVFAWPAYGDFDAMGADDGNISLYGRLKGISGLVALGAYELQSTEFITGTYNPNTPLTSEETPGADLGKLKEGVYYTDPIVGIVSDGQLTNVHGKTVVQFWSYFLPA